MINTILFDIDGTLLNINKESFHKEYTKSLCIHFMDICSLEAMAGILKIGTINMMTNDGTRSNKEAFTEHLRDTVGKETDKYLDHFDKYYKEEFSKLSVFGKEKKPMIDSIKLLKSKGYKLAIASNPMLPLEAMKHRVRWSGLLPTDFDLISSFEKNTSTKPNPKFYTELSKELNISPENCIMVGDDIKEDMVASTIGMKTFFLTDNPIKSNFNDYSIDYEGSSNKFYEFVKELPKINY